MKSAYFDLEEWRTLIINGITGAVALSLAANVLRNREVEPRPWTRTETAPFVEIVVPARNEEANILPLLTSLLRQQYPPGRYRVTVVDDHSTDSTAALARALEADYPQLRVLATPPLPEGWTGKNHALWTGAEHANPQADWLLFTDADTRHHPLMLPSIVQQATRVRADLLSLIISISMETFWQRVLVPQVGELYALLVGSMDAVNGRGKAAAANGQFILIRPELYRRTGAAEAVRSDVAEDRALAAACKAAGATVNLQYGRKLVTTEAYNTFALMWRSYAKTLFWATGHNTGRALLAAASLAFYALVPTAGLIRALFATNGRTRARGLRHAALRLLPMMVLRAAVCKQVGVPLRYAATYPLAVAVANAMLLHSLYSVVSGRGVTWKGRTYRK
jgi:chlorobactene glucosyltransferase